MIDFLNFKKQFLKRYFGHTLTFLFFDIGWFNQVFSYTFFQAFVNLVLTHYLANFLSFLLSIRALIAFAFSDIIIVIGISEMHV